MSVLSTFKLDGKQLIVTGGGQGLGREIAIGLQKQALMSWWCKENWMLLKRQRRIFESKENRWP
jgi:hypothetical protein